MKTNHVFESLGYGTKLCILPFDHRSYFEELLGFKEPLTPEQSAQLSDYKKVVYGGYEASLSLGISKAESAILVDDVFGIDILLDAKQKGYNVLQSTEVSGDNHFEFQHGTEWQAWIEKVKPTFVKALVRYNPADHQALNIESIRGLKELSLYAHSHGYKFLIEPLVPASAEQIASVGGEASRYDRELRPALTVGMITELQEGGVEPDIWKIEGMFKPSDYAQVVAAATRDGRAHVGVISLGRNETDEVVSEWLKAGAATPGVIGFAVGRTIFLDALLKYKSGELTREQASQKIAERFKFFYDIFNAK